MKYFHGETKKNRFFEGWYIKHQAEGNIIAFIPSIHINEKGQKSASLQVITNTASYSKDFPATAFSAAKGRFYCKLGDTIFSQKGISINTEFEGLTIRGKLFYDNFLPLESSIMGPFQYIPFLKCNHGILSLSHKLKGYLLLNEKKLDFTNGTGYIETDWGSSFPDSYLWTQCNWYDKGDCCIMLSIAHIPFPFKSFTGCICSIYYAGKEYRLATYLGVRILTYTKQKVVLVQGTNKLEIKVLEQNPFPLKAPVNGSLKRSIQESAFGTVKYRFSNNNQEIFTKISSNASFEYVGS